MANFTKGYWELHGNKTPHISSDFAGTGDIADLYHETEDGEIFVKDNAVANGHLISAAPDLYYAAKLLLDQLEHILFSQTGSNDEFDKLTGVSAVKQSILKAEGNI